MTTVRWLVAAVTLLFATPASACPSCATGEEARAEVLGDHFVRNLAMLLLPLLVVGLVSVGAERIDHPSRSRR